VEIILGQARRRWSEDEKRNARLRPLGFRPVALEPAESEQILVGDTIDLDGRRGMAAQKATRLRRQLSMVYAADAALRQEELDILLAAAPATGWGEAVAKARYLLILFAQTPAAKRFKIIADRYRNRRRRFGLRFFLIAAIYNMELKVA
jgi:hypothetical protein